MINLRPAGRQDLASQFVRSGTESYRRRVLPPKRWLASQPAFTDILCFHVALVDGVLRRAEFTLHYECSMMHFMDETTTALATAIGKRVRQERQSRGWTLDQLADTAEVSRRMVVNVEQGAVNPSVGTLLRISDALGIGLPALVESPRPKPVTVTRSGEGAALWTSASGGCGVLVAGTESPDVVELWDWTLAPDDRHQSQAHSPGTKELLQVQDGNVTVVVGGESYLLEAGDAVSFPGDVSHSYANPGPGPVRFSLAVFEPGVGAGHQKKATDA